MCLIIELIIACMHLLHLHVATWWLWTSFEWRLESWSRCTATNVWSNFWPHAKSTLKKIHRTPKPSQEFPQKVQRERSSYVSASLFSKCSARTVIWANKTEKCTGPWARLLLRNFLDLLRTVPYTRRCFYYSTSVWEPDE